MDPITVVGFLAAIVQLIDTTSKVVTYFNGVKNAPKERAKLTREGHRSSSTLYRLEMSGGRSDHINRFMVYGFTVTWRGRRTFDGIQNCNGGNS